MTRSETVLVLASCFVGSLFAGLLIFSSGATGLAVGIAALIGFDVLAGAVCNGTVSTRARPADGDHRPAQAAAAGIGQSSTSRQVRPRIHSFSSPLSSGLP